MHRLLIAAVAGLWLAQVHAETGPDMPSVQSGSDLTEVVTDAVPDTLANTAPDAFIPSPDDPVADALQQALEATPEEAYVAITTAVQRRPGQAASLVSRALDLRYDLNPEQVVAAALQGAPERAGVIVPTAIVRAPGYHTIPIVQRALAEGVDGALFLPQAMRASPRQAETLLTQALQLFPLQTRSVMEAVIADQPDMAIAHVRLALEAKAPASDVLTAAFKTVPRQAEAIAAAAVEAGIASTTVSAAGMATGVEVCLPSAGASGKKAQRKSCR